MVFGHSEQSTALFESGSDLGSGENVRLCFKKSYQGDKVVPLQGYPSPVPTGTRHGFGESIWEWPECVPMDSASKDGNVATEESRI